MPHIKPDIESFARIKVVGVGGSGKNAVNHMIRSKVRGVEFIAVNTDAQDLHQSLAHKKIRIGKGVTKGLGTGMNPDLGRQAAEETKDEIHEVLKGADMVFITCGMGGGTGTGGAPVVAHAAKAQGALAIGVVTKPFAFEGMERARIAEGGLIKLREAVDALIVIPNDKLLSVVTKDTPFLSAFAMCDEVLRHAVEGISDLITIPGIINVDFADVRAVMQSAGSALMAIGHGGADLTMWEINEAAKIITSSVDQDARIIFGAIHDERLKKGDVRITVIASGFPDDHIGKTATLFGPSAGPAGLPKSSFTPKTASSSTPIVGGGQNINGVKKPENGANGQEESEWDSIPAFIRRQRK